MPREAIALHDVSVVLGGAPVLDGVELVVHDGERVALVGPSGAGKTTLLRLCTGAVRATSGSVQILGVDLDDITDRRLRRLRRRIGHLRQRLDLVEELRVVHNVNAGRLGTWTRRRAVMSLVRPGRADDARAALARFGLDDKLLQPTAQLSGGELQRVAMARVLLQDPQLMLADEPMSSLDPARAAELMDVLFDVVVDRSGEPRTAIVSLHAFDETRRRFDRVVALRTGRVLFDLPASAVTGDHAAQLYTIGTDAPR